MVEHPETRFAYRAPVDPIFPENMRPTPAGDVLEDALQQVLVVFASFPYRGSAKLFERGDAQAVRCCCSRSARDMSTP